MKASPNRTPSAVATAFPFVLILEHSDLGTFERIVGTEPGRPMFGATKRTIPAVHTNGMAHETAVWGRKHPGHPYSTWEPLHPVARFSYGGCWYDSLEDWAARWNATITERVPCDRSGVALDLRDFGGS